METGNDKSSGVRRAVLCGLSALIAVTCFGCDYLGLSGESSGNAQGEQESAEKSGKESSGEGSSESSEEGDGREEGEESEAMERPPELAADETDAGAPKPKRNPFAPQVEIEEEEESDEEEDAPDLGPLRKHPVGNYRLAGIISEVAVPKAMFIAPDGMGYQIKEGEEIGQKGGVVKDIRRNEVEIEMPSDERESEPMVLTVELRKEALPGSGEDSRLSEEEREMLERLRAKQQSEEDSENGSTSDEENASEEVSEEGPEAAGGGTR